MQAGLKTVLLIEDDGTIRAIVRRVLARGGFAIETVDCGSSALQWIENAAERPGAVIIDYTLPDMNGAKLLTALQQRWGEERPPTILLTGSVEQVDAEDAHRFDRVLSKPFAVDELEAIVRELME